jgi:aspartate kinase
MVVMKFGGSSVANGERISKVAEIVQSVLPQKPLLVLSAMGDTTDFLLEAGAKAISEGPVSVETAMFKINEIHLEALQQLGVCNSVPPEISSLMAELAGLLSGVALIKELTGRTRDYLVSFGERLSVRVVALYFEHIGIKAKAIDAWDAGFVSDSNFTHAELLPETWERIPQKLLPIIEAGFLPIVTGFIAKDADGMITTLGRGGSDLSATMIASACKASEVQVWKDVDGILTADPRIIKEARPVPRASYEEAAELAYFGAEVLHPRAMQPCMKTGTAVHVKNSYNPAAPGTVISAAPPSDGALVRAITSKKKITLVDIVSTRMLGQYGFLAEVFQIFANAKISIDMVATSEVSVSLTVDADTYLDDVKNTLSKIADVNIKEKKAIVTIVGDVKRAAEILHRMSVACVKASVQPQMISQGASKVNISFIVNAEEGTQLIKALHSEFFGDAV